MRQKRVLPDAVANIRGSEEHPNLRGQVRFYQRRHCVLVEANVDGLPTTETGFFGFHIHGGGSCTGADFADTGSHHNPADTPHPRHAGDLPPLLSCQGGAYLAVATGRFRIGEVIGCTVVVHDRADDFSSQPAGNAGTKIACGVIRRGWG